MLGILTTAGLGSVAFTYSAYHIATQRGQLQLADVVQNVAVIHGSVRDANADGSAAHDRAPAGRQ